jgi:hypothetical protein
MGRPLPGSSLPNSSLYKQMFEQKNYEKGVVVQVLLLADLVGINKRQRLQQPITEIDEEPWMVLGEQVLVQAH